MSHALSSIPIALLKSNFHKQGGLEKSTQRIACHFASKGHPVTLLTTPPPQRQENPSPLQFVYLSSYSWPAFLQLRHFDSQCTSWLQAHKEIPIILGMDRNRVQTHLRAGNGLHRAYLETRKKSDPLLKRWTFSCNPLHRTILDLEKKALTNPLLQKVLVNSYKVRQEMIHYYGVDPQKIAVIHNGVEWTEKEQDFTCWTEKKLAFEKKFSLSPSSQHFLFVGHGYARKGLKILLYALSLLSKKDFILSVVGKEKNLPYYFALCKQLGLEKKVLFWGPQKDVTPFYQLADTLLIPSFYDPFANVTLEGLAMGLFVISSSSNGGSEILTKENGLIVQDPYSIEELSLALQFRIDCPKTPQSALQIRNSVAYLDFSTQLELFYQTILTSFQRP